MEADDAAAVRVLLSPEFDPGRDVVLADGSGAVPPSSFEATVAIRERRAERLALETVSNAPGWVVVVDAWDPGWQARVDGRPTRVQRANVAFRAVAVPAGRHAIELVFRPRGLVAAAWISAASVLALLAGLALTARGPARPAS